MKKRLSKCLAVTMLFSLVFANVSFAQGDSQVDGLNEKKQYLIERGFPQDILEGLKAGYIEQVYKSVLQKDDVKIDVQTDTVEKEFSENIGGVETRDNIEESKLRITTTLMNYAHPTYGFIQGCDIIVDYKWIVTPGAVGNDAITLNFNNSVFSLADYGNGPISAHNFVTNISNGTEDYYNFISNPAIANSGGIGWYAKLQSPNVVAKLQANPGGGAFISLEPSYMFYASDNIVTDFRLQYTHEKLPGVSSISFSLAGAGVSASGNFTDTLAKIATYRSNIVNDW